MTLSFEDLRILQTAETIADAVWNQVVDWQPFARDAMGKQLIQAADSIGANIAEAFGRYHYGEKLNFLYYARGSLFETKYWINRAVARTLIDDKELRDCIAQLADLARQLNALASATRQQRAGQPAGQQTSSKSIREPGEPYDALALEATDLFSLEDLAWLTEH